MGASESSMILEQELESFKESVLVESFSSAKYKDVLRLYKLLSQDNQTEDEGTSGSYLEDNLLNNYTVDDTESREYYIVTLVNQNNPRYVFNISRCESQEEAKHKFT